MECDQFAPFEPLAQRPTAILQDASAFCENKVSWSDSELWAKMKELLATEKTTTTHALNEHILQCFVDTCMNGFAQLYRLSPGAHPKDDI